MDGISALAREVPYRGVSQPVLEDDAILGYARKTGMSVREAVLSALRGGIIPARYLKNFWGLDFPAQERIAGATVLLCGCGGLGGILCELLARAGVGALRLCDGDAFEATNLNRQLLSTVATLGASKAETAAARVAAINPLVEAEAFVGVATEENAGALVSGASVVCDALDNLAGRFAVSEAAKSLGVPFVHAAVAGWWGQLTTILPGSPVTLRAIYGAREKRDPAEEALGVLGATAAAVGSLSALEALRVITGRPPVYAGRLAYFDGEGGELHIIPLHGDPPGEPPM